MSSLIGEIAKALILQDPAPNEKRIEKDKPEAIEPVLHVPAAISRLPFEQLRSVLHKIKVGLRTNDGLYALRLFAFPAWSSEQEVARVIAGRAAAHIGKVDLHSERNA